MDNYIRTTKKIFSYEKGMKIQNYYFNGKEVPNLIFDDGATRLEFLGPIISQSNDLEELFDCIIAIEEPSTSVDDYHLIRDKHKADSKREWLDDHGLSFIDDNGKVKGVVFTKNGWEYVAEMNEKGKFELI